MGVVIVHRMLLTLMLFTLARFAAAEEVEPAVPPPPPMTDDPCGANVPLALAELKTVVRIDQAAEVRVVGILAELCDAARSQPPQQAGATTSLISGCATAPTEAETTRVLGIDIRKAPPGADGYDRTRK